jgi:hypothetical protein
MQGTRLFNRLKITIMKKKLLIRFIVLSTSAIFFSSAYPQLTTDRGAGLNKQADSSSALPKASGKDADKMVLAGIKAVNTKMFAHFTRNYRNASDISVRAAGENTSISFKVDGISNRVQYNKKGKWLYAIRNYEESKLSNDIRRRVEEANPGFIVFGFVTEIDVLDKSACLVMIENKTAWKRIRIVGDEMDVYESYIK